MRVASAVIGGIGALLGVAKGLLSGVTMLLVMTRQGERGLNWLNSYNLLDLGAQVALVASCLFGMVGAALILGRSRLRAGVLMLLASAVGVAVVAVSFGLLSPLTQPSDYRAVTSPFVLFTEPIFYLLFLFPVPFLLVGATLAFIAYRRGEAESAVA